jgi:hypothetical protein
MTEKIKPRLIGVASGGVNRNGRPTWLTRRQIRAAVVIGKAHEELGIAFDYAFVPTSAGRNEHATMRRMFKELHPDHDRELVSTPEGLSMSRSRGKRFIERVGRVRGQIPLIVSLI